MSQATLNGILVDDGGEPCQCRFRYGTTLALGLFTPFVPGITTGVPISATLLGLTPGTTYFFQAEAVNSAGTSLGAVWLFTTLVVKPTVTTALASNVLRYSAALPGTLIDDGGALCSVGFEWGTDATSLSSSQNVGSGRSPLPFSVTPCSFSPSTTYYFRAFATNSAGTGYGSINSFTTGDTLPPIPVPPWTPPIPPAPVPPVPGSPLVTTNPAYSIMSSYAILPGTLIYDGGEQCSYGFQYGRYSLSQTYTVGVGRSELDFAILLYALSPGTRYYYRAFATNSKGTGYGLTLSFTTTSGAPIPPSDIPPTPGIPHVPYVPEVPPIPAPPFPPAPLPPLIPGLPVPPIKQALHFINIGIVVGGSTGIAMILAGKKRKKKKESYG